MAAPSDSPTGAEVAEQAAQSEGAATAAPAGKKSPRKSANARKSAGTAPANKTRTMTAEHKEALDIGRKEGRVVGDYLDALDQHKPKRGRRVTPDTIRERIRTLNEETIPTTTGKDKLAAIQSRMDLEDQLRRAEDTTIVGELEEAFKKVAKSYSERRGISYEAFREAGVPPAVLKEAGVARHSA